jgi:hypothetical protein
MRLGDCVIETELGSVDLGIRAQLGEIERGFFDRAGGRSPAGLQIRRRARRAARPLTQTRAEHACPDAAAGARYFARLERGQPWRWRGQVLESVGQTIESAGRWPRWASAARFRTSSAAAPGRGDRLSRLECAVDAGRDDRGHSLWRSGGGAGRASRDRGGPALMGRVLNALGEPIDEGRPPAVSVNLAAWRAWCGAARPRADRTPLGTGIRVLDALLTVGRGSGWASSAARAWARAR